MGARSSSNKHDTATPSAAPSSASPVTPFRHAIILNGLAGSGKSAVQSILGVRDGRKLQVDSRFLTTPQILGYNSNMPDYGSKNIDKSVWLYGGRGSFRARWQTIATNTKAIVFTIDSTDRERLVPAVDFKPLPEEFIFNYNNKTPQEQTEILATLEKQMTSKSMLEKILDSQGRKPLLILATKQDVEGAMTPEEICEKLNLHALNKVMKRDWRIAGCDALTGEGIQESVDWLNYVIANPTDWSHQDKEEQAEWNKASSKINWDERRAVLAIRWEVQQRAEARRNLRLARGDVLPAPPIFKTNGERFVLTPEQRAEFVVPPLSIDEEEEENPPASSDASPVTVGPVVPAVTVEASPLDDVHLAKQLIDLIQHEEIDRPGTPELSAYEPESFSAANEREHSVSAASRASTVVEERVIEVEVMPTQKKEADEQKKHADSVSLKTLPSSRKFLSVSSTHLAMPSPSSIPTLRLEFRKKHWYSKAKLMPVEEEERDIHQLHERSFLF